VCRKESRCWQQKPSLCTFASVGTSLAYSTHDHRFSSGLKTDLWHPQSSVIHHTAKNSVKLNIRCCAYLYACSVRLRIAVSIDQHPVLDCIPTSSAFESRGSKRTAKDGACTSGTTRSPLSPCGTSSYSVLPPTRARPHPKRPRPLLPSPLRSRGKKVTFLSPCLISISVFE
jgi:hypothetical protein